MARHQKPIQSDEARALSLQAFGVDLQAHWPEQARHRSAVKRQARIERIEWRLWRGRWMREDLAIARSVSVKMINMTRVYDHLFPSEQA